jgi:hypothetical protein
MALSNMALAQNSGQGQKQFGGGGTGGAGGQGYGGGERSIGNMIDELLKGHGGRVIIILEDDTEDGPPEWAGGNQLLNPHRPASAGGGNAGSGGSRADLYADLWIIERDDNGEPIYYYWIDTDADGWNDTQLVWTESSPVAGFVQPLDDEGNPIPLTAEGEPYNLDDPASIPGTPVPESYTLEGDPSTDDDDIVVSAYPTLTDTQEVELGRTNVIRSPDQVLEHALDEALTKIFEATTITLDEAGRIVVDGVTIDSPLENLALYSQYMLNDGTLVYVDADGLAHLITLPEDFNAASLLGAATDKPEEMTLDEVVYMNTILGINAYNEDGELIYWDSSTYDSYSRLETYPSTLLVTYAVVNEEGTGVDIYTDVPLADAVFGSVVLDGDGNIVIEETAGEWVDPTDLYGIDDLTQAADDSRAVIEFLHEVTLISSSGS